jgi:hypothetical protein
MFLIRLNIANKKHGTWLETEFPVMKFKTTKTIPTLYRTSLYLEWSGLILSWILVSETGVVEDNHAVFTCQFLQSESNLLLVSYCVFSRSVFSSDFYFHIHVYKLFLGQASSRSLMQSNAGRCVPRRAMSSSCTTPSLDIVQLCSLLSHNLWLVKFPNSISKSYTYQSICGQHKPRQTLSVVLEV